MENTYSAKLKSYKWAKLRQKILERDFYTCRDCYAVEQNVNVHHLYYIPGKEPWEVPDDALILLCEDCHKIEHERFDRYVGPKRDLSLKTKGFRARDYESLVFVGMSLMLGGDVASCIESVCKGIKMRNDAFQRYIDAQENKKDREYDEWE